MSRENIHLALIEFNEINELHPFTINFSPFSIKILGKPLIFHILQSIKEIFNITYLECKFSDTNLEKDINTCISLTEPALDQDIQPDKTFYGSMYWVSPDNYILLKYPWSLLKVMAATLARQKSYISSSAIIESDELEGNIYIGDGVKICRGAILKGDIYIGENSLIGNNAFIRGPVSIGKNTKIGYTTEVKNALICENNRIGPLCFIADSVIGPNCLLGAMVRTSNYRLDRNTIKIKVENKFIDSKMEKLGAFIGANVQIGISVIVMPGRKIEPYTHIGPKIIVKQNLEGGIKYTLKQELEAQKLSIPE
jgi:UDP-N-acetylglucosamine diphosphorylase / glucose-1-phosphate thymidylyltransferase / UDP-N-acetylgalactosamine diphosphorylase / glucosamine-1-phosphate N-acetyltransferase / galactosamine-1-phosphate N-acetyltransferase